MVSIMTSGPSLFQGIGGDSSHGLSESCFHTARQWWQCNGNRMWIQSSIVIQCVATFLRTVSVVSMYCIVDISAVEVLKLRQQIGWGGLLWWGNDQGNHVHRIYPQNPAKNRTKLLNSNLFSGPLVPKFRHICLTAGGVQGYREVSRRGHGIA